MATAALANQQEASHRFRVYTVSSLNLYVVTISVLSHGQLVQYYAFEHASQALSLSVCIKLLMMYVNMIEIFVRYAGI